MKDTRGLFTQTVARPDPNHSFPPFPSHHQALLERISDGVLADDRRSAAHELRDLVQESRVAQFAIGVIGLPTLITSLTEERNDTELVHGVLEVLVNALTGGVAGVDGGADTAVREGGEGAHLAHAGAANADAFVRNPANLELALSLLDEEDFYVRYHTMQLLTALSTTNPFEVQSAIMSNPTGVGRLMDNLTEREVIRNETLLLLISLTRGSEDLRKIVAFEGAFERCFNVIREEGAADGGIIVQDCLELCNNLLRGSPSNQSFFRESSFLHQLPEMLSLKVPSQAKGGPPLAPQKAANLLCALELVTMLVSSSDVGGPAKSAVVNVEGGDDVAAEIAARERAAKEQCRAANQAALAKAGMLDTLLAMCLGVEAVDSVPVRVFALRCLGDMVADSRRNQDLLFAAAVRVADVAGKGGYQTTERSEPALLACLRVALRGLDAAERTAAEGVFARCLRGNAELQIMLISTIAPAGEEDDDGERNVSLGGLLARALTGKSPHRKGDDPTPIGAPNELEVSCHAAAVLRHALDGNATAKARILTIPLEMPKSSSEPPDLLLPRIMRFLSAAVRSSSSSALGEGAGGGGGGVGGAPGFTNAERIAAAAAARKDAEKLQAVLLRLLIAWLYGCAPAVNSFLAPAAHLPMLADLARDSGSSAHVAGLASVLLGCCLCAETLDGHVDAHAVLDVVTARVGLNEFFGRWEEMRKTPEFIAAAAAPVLAKPLTRVTAQKLVNRKVGESDGRGEEDATGGLYDHSMASFIDAFEESVKECVITLYARPKPVTAGDFTGSWEAKAGESAEAHAARLKSLLRSQDAELAEQRARNAVLAEQLARGGGGGGGPGADPEASGSIPDGVESSQVKAAMEHAKAALDAELRAVKLELEESRSATAGAEESLRSLSEAYNGLEAEVFRHEEENRALRERLEGLGAEPKPLTAPTSSEADLAAAREEGRAGAIAEMARRIEEAEEAAAADVVAAEERGRRSAIAEFAAKLDTSGMDDDVGAVAAAREEGRREGAAELARVVQEKDAEAAEAAEQAESELNDLLVCLGQEESKKEALLQRLIERHGEDEAELEELMDACVAEEDEDA